ncbi:MAG: hypothetical protein B6D64_14890 [Bacteroidetes bacterium 4484_276]|nr:MAG: hypothetical protein B6D64_14890 [Bacteroidetes bacterium 4484_276]
MKLTILSLLLLCCIPAYARLMEVPVLQGDWWQIAEKAPDVSPYNSPTHNACDFSIWQDDSNTWHLVACIRGTTYPGATRLFHSWESPSLTNTMWESSSFINTFVTNGIPVTVTNGIFAVAQDSLNQWPGVMQAPHCFKEDGQFYFFYNAAYDWNSRKGNGAWYKISPDGTTYSFTDYTNYLGNDMLFTMGRDVMVFDNRAVDGLWYASYTGAGPDKPTDHVAARTATSLAGPWSTEVLSLSIYGNPESPFIVKRGEWYYLWQQSQVRASKTVTNFTDMVTDMAFGWKYAPEIVELNGQEYIVTYGNGIHVSKFGWITKEVTDADLVKMQGNFDEPSFDSTNTVYLGKELKSKTTVKFSRFLPAQETSTQTVTVFNASNPSGAPVTVIPGNFGEKNTEDISIDYGENRIEIQITAENDLQKTYVIFVNKQNSDSSYDSYIVPMNMYPNIQEGSQQNIGVRLSEPPDAATTVTVSKVAGGSAALLLVDDPNELVFSSFNYDTPQNITLRADADSDLTNSVATFRCSAPGMTDKDIVATEHDGTVPEPTMLWMIALCALLRWLDCWNAGLLGGN